MSQPRADTRSLNEVERATFRSFLERYAFDVETSLRKMRQAQARHVEHVGGATAAELRDLWEDEFSHGPTKRQLIPDQYALLWALADTARTTDEAALESGQPGMDEFDAAGLHVGFRKHIMGKFSPYEYEAFYQTCSRRWFNRKRLSGFVQSLLPGICSLAKDIRDMEGIARIFKNLPAWIWEEAAAPKVSAFEDLPVTDPQAAAVDLAAETHPAAAGTSASDHPVLEVCSAAGADTSAASATSPAAVPRQRKRALARRR